MKKNIIAVAMNGMNVSSQRDMDHKFNVHQYFRYPRIVQKEIQDGEYERSTLFYELYQAVDFILNAYNLEHNDIQMIFGRGRLLEGTEKRLTNNLIRQSEIHGKDAFKVIVAKSFGGVDTIDALHTIADTPAYKDKVGKVNLLLVLDPTATRLSAREHAEKVGNEFFIKIPDIVDRTVNVYQTVQKRHGKHGYQVKGEHVENYLLDPDKIIGKTYNEWIDDNPRPLKVCHKHMEEIVAGPGILTEDEDHGTMFDLITQAYATYVGED